MSNDSELQEKIKDLKPWHQIIPITDQITTSSPFVGGKSLSRAENDGVALIELREPFLSIMSKLYPEGLDGKSIMDCACNAGAYCFFARELGAKHAVGFDARKHWIDQAEFVKENRVVAPTDSIDFHHTSLYDVPDLNLGEFDFTVFKGLYYHLPDPFRGLQIAANHTREILWFNSAFAPMENVMGLVQKVEGTESVMSGIDGLSYYPTHPMVVGEQLDLLGFKDVRLQFSRESGAKDCRGRYQSQYSGGRMSIIAAREKGRLESIYRETVALPERAHLTNAQDLLFFEPDWEKINSMSTVES